MQQSSVPGASWKAARVEADLALSKELMLKLDAEKGIESNPLEAHAAAQPVKGSALLHPMKSSAMPPCALQITCPGRLCAIPYLFLCKILCWDV